MARRRRPAAAEPPARVEFAPAEGCPVVPQHEEWGKAFIEWFRGPGQGFGSLEWTMDRMTEARDHARAVEEQRGEFFTSSSWDWARHLLGPDADRWAVNALCIELHKQWKPRV